MCPYHPWFHHPERRLLSGFLGLLLSVLAGGCATTTTQMAPDVIEEASPTPQSEAAQFIPVVRYGRYTLVEMAPKTPERRSAMGCGTCSSAAAISFARRHMP
jgi:hypothetical protein